MGAWGTGPFDNDIASDWASDLDDAVDVTAFVRETCQAVSTTEYVEAGDGSQVVAAAAWLASALPGGRPVEPHYGPTRAVPGSLPALATLVAPALERVLAEDSEWRELWDEADESEPIELARADLATLRALS